VDLALSKVLLCANIPDNDQCQPFVDTQWYDSRFGFATHVTQWRKMWEVPGSNPGLGHVLFFFLLQGHVLLLQLGGIGTLLGCGMEKDYYLWAL
jgi:hypothetical protein